MERNACPIGKDEGECDKQETAKRTGNTHLKEKVMSYSRRGNGVEEREFTEGACGC